MVWTAVLPMVMTVVLTMVLTSVMIRLREPAKHQASKSEPPVQGCYQLDMRYYIRWQGNVCGI